MKKIIITLVILVTITLILATVSGCIYNNNIVNRDTKSQTYYNENNKENYFTLYPEDHSFVYIEIIKDGSQTFDLSKVGNYKIEDDNIFLSIPAGMVLRGKINNETTIISSRGTKWIKE